MFEILFVVREAEAIAYGNSFQTRGYGIIIQPVSICGIDDFGHSQQCFICKVVVFDDDIKGAQIVLMAKFNPGCVKRYGYFPHGNIINLTIRNVQNFRVTVHKAFDEPGTGHPIHMNMRSCYPFHPFPSFL